MTHFVCRTPEEQAWMDEIIASHKTPLSYCADPFIAIGWRRRIKQCNIWNTCQAQKVSIPTLPGFRLDSSAEPFTAFGFDRRLQQCQMWNECKKEIYDIENGDLYQ